MVSPLKSNVYFIAVNQPTNKRFISFSNQYRLKLNQTRLFPGSNSDKKYLYIPSVLLQMVSPLKSKVYFIVVNQPLQIKKVYIILQSIQA